MTKFVVINWNEDAISGEGATLQKAVDAAVSNSDMADFFVAIECDQVCVYEEIKGNLSLGKVTFTAEKIDKKVLKRNPFKDI